MTTGKLTLTLAAALGLSLSTAVHAAQVDAADLDYGISGKNNNNFEFDFTGQPVWTAGSQRSDNGGADPTNQRAGRVFVDFQLDDGIIYAAKTPLGAVSLTFTVDSIGQGVSGTPYTDGLDLRFLNVSGSDRSAATLWNVPGVGGDQSDIVTTAGPAGTYTITITNAAVKAAIAGASVGDYISFGMSNSTGVDNGAPVGTSTAETYGFQMNQSTSSYTIEVEGTRTVMPTGITQTQGNTLAGAWSPTNLINGSGLSGPVDATNFGSVSHTLTAANGWVTSTSTGPNYFNGSNPEPQFVIDLGGTWELGGLLVWGYGGNNNEASDFLVEFSTDGGSTWSLSTETVATSSLLGNGNELLEFAAFHLADTVRLTITDNAGGRGFGGVGTGDRVGFGELKFLAIAPAPAALPAGLGMLCLAACRRARRRG